MRISPNLTISWKCITQPRFIQKWSKYPLLTNKLLLITSPLINSLYCFIANGQSKWWKGYYPDGVRRERFCICCPAPHWGKPQFSLNRNCRHNLVCVGNRSFCRQFLLPKVTPSHGPTQNSEYAACHGKCIRLTLPNPTISILRVYYMKQFNLGVEHEIK